MNNGLRASACLRSTNQSITAGERADDRHGAVTCRAIANAHAIDVVGAAIDGDGREAIRAEEQLGPLDVGRDVGDRAVGVEHGAALVVCSFAQAHRHVQMRARQQRYGHLLLNGGRMRARIAWTKLRRS